MPEPEGGAAPVIIIKKVQGHGGHHGGAWKVAYADFVTAMMALFIVLWLLNTNQKVQKAVAAYFKDPSGNGKQLGSTMAGTGDALSVSKGDMGKLKEKIEQAMRQMPKFAQMKDNVELTITNEGLRVELLESAKGMFFESGNARPTDNGEELLVRLAQELGSIPNPILIEGHTDATPYSGVRDYGNWELSADRANSARRIMEANALHPGQVKQVRGFADQRLRIPNEPTNPSNRRVSVIIQYMTAPAPESVPAAPAKPALMPSAKTAPVVKPNPTPPASAPPAKPAAAPPAKTH
ncbi:MAG TPA: flagellar motor protein MotB [Bryobacteraceae bacterium]|nr:flagellar motor protein MotB [Bryobacteraceae bacterium]